MVFDIYTTMAVLLPAEHIPVGSTVTKKTGEKEYTLKDRIRVYSVDVPGEKIIDIEGYFMVDSQGNIEQIEANKVIVWITNLEELDDLYHELEAGLPQ